MHGPITRPIWFPDWTGQTCVIVASGPSAAEAGVDQTRDRARCIAVNSSWQLAPWADILFGCDYAWWKSVDGCPDFAGLKVTTADRAVAQTAWGLHKLKLNQGDYRLETRKLGTVGWGGNSGFHAFNLSVQLGCARIILVGYDMTVANGVHWHGPHPKGMNNPRAESIVRWRRAMDDAAKVTAKLGVEVVNASPISTLTAYPKMTLADALG